MLAPVADAVRGFLFQARKAYHDASSATLNSDLRNKAILCDDFLAHIRITGAKNVD
jgi:hypothetical protein